MVLCIFRRWSHSNDNNYNNIDRKALHPILATTNNNNNNNNIAKSIVYSSDNIGVDIDDVATICQSQY